MTGQASPTKPVPAAARPLHKHAAVTHAFNFS
jgi:hypothetical protein